MEDGELLEGVLVGGAKDGDNRPGSLLKALLLSLAHSGPTATHNTSNTLLTAASLSISFDEERRSSLDSIWAGVSRERVFI